MVTWEEDELAQEVRDLELAAGDAAGPAFVEVLSPMLGGRSMGCVLELERPGGSRVRVEGKDISAQDLVTLVRGLAA